MASVVNKEGSPQSKFDQWRNPSPVCSFCYKPRSGQLRFINGPHGVAICEQCVDLCNQILTERLDPPAE